MGLLYWWPLTKNLKGNLGQDLTLYTGSLVTQTSGIISKNNYYFNGSTCFYYPLNSIQTTELLENNAITVAMWLKLDTTQDGWGQVFTIGQSGTSWTNIRFGLDNQSGSKLCFSISDGSTQTGTNYASSSNLQDGKWHHVVAIYNTNTLKLYIDGNLQGSGVTTAFTPVFPSSGCYIHIGGNTGGEHSESSIQDVRIYNHAISLKEIKDLSNACILSYDFKDPSMSSTTNQNVNSSWSAYESYFKIKSYTDTGVIVYRPTNSTNNVLALSNSSLRTKMKTGEVWTMTGYLYVNGKPHKSTSGMSSYAAFPTEKMESRDDGFFRVTTTIKNESDAWIFHAPIFGSVGLNIDCEIRYLQFEKTAYYSPFTKSSRTAKIMDSSGFGNHSTETQNVITAKNRSSKEDTCLQLSSSYIKTLITAPVMSYTMWYKTGDFPSSNFVLFADGTNYLSFGRYNTYLCLSCDGKSVRTVNVSAITNWSSDWNHIAITKDSSDTYKLYINGIEPIYNSANDHWTHGIADLIIGARNNGTYSMHSTGYLRDFKAYSKTLSDTDIKSMVQSEIRFLNSHAIQASNIFETSKNRAEPMNDAIFRKTMRNGVYSYTQAHCQVTITDKGLRIYRTPNLTQSSNGSVMWGGMKLTFLDLGQFTTVSYTNSDTSTSTSYNKSDFFQKGKRYRISFHISGYSQNSATSFGFTNNMGWGGGGLNPSPSDIVSKGMGTNFGISNGTIIGDEMDCFYEFTINDDIYKTCTTAYSSFVKGNIYPSYRDFMFGFAYDSTGLGTDIYITDIRCSEIPTTEITDINKYQSKITPLKGGTLNITESIIDKVYTSTNIEVSPDGLIGTNFVEEIDHLGSTIIESKARSRETYSEKISLGSVETTLLSGAIKDNKTSTNLVTADQIIAYINSL